MGKKLNLDWQLTLSHLVYIFVISSCWLILSIWGGIALKSYYETLPQSVPLFISLSRWLGGIGLGIGAFLVGYTILER